MFALLLTLSMTGCKKNKDDDAANAALRMIVGEWHCVPEVFDADVYVLFGDDGTYNLYQRVGEGRYRCYVGSWWLNGTILSGNYGEDTPWGDDYAVAHVDATTMTLTAQGSQEVMTYTKEAIPTEIIAEAVEVRSSAFEECPIL